MRIRVAAIAWPDGQEARVWRLGHDQVATTFRPALWGEIGPWMEVETITLHSSDRDLPIEDLAREIWNVEGNEDRGPATVPSEALH